MGPARAPSRERLRVASVAHERCAAWPTPDGGENSPGMKLSASEKAARFRDRQGLTLAQLGALWGCSRSMAQAICLGARRPGLDLAARIEVATDGLIACREWAEPLEAAA